MAAPCRGFASTRLGALLLQLPSQGFTATSRRKQLRPSFPLTTHARYPAISHPLQTKRLLDSVCLLSRDRKQVSAFNDSQALTRSLQGAAGQPKPHLGCSATPCAPHPSQSSSSISGSSWPISEGH